MLCDSDPGDGSYKFNSENHLRWLKPLSDYRRNGSGYFDPTAYIAIKNITKKKGKKINTMNANEYQKLAARTVSKDMDNEKIELHALHGMVGEIGELHSIYQKIYQGHKADVIHQKKELGDLLWFIAEYCTAKGWKLEDVMQLNIDKLKARFPDGFEAERSLHRKAGDI
jgi:NTP pyrophosphatase (non-canonical NTP hydrolase)